MKIQRGRAQSFLFDGVKAQSLENLDQWMDATQLAQFGSDTHGMYAAVPVVFRCTHLRANGVARVPCYIMRGVGDEQEPIDYPLEYMLPRLFWLTEAALTLYGAAYWLREKNRAGVEGYRWLVPSSIKILADDKVGLTGFERTVGTQKILYKPEDLVYFWQPALDKEVGPGVAPAQAAFEVAGLQKNANAFASAFFNRGAIPATLLTVEGNPPQTELDRLENWWKRLLQGVQRAWETVAVRAGITVQTIQQPIKDLAMTDLTTSARQQVALALGVPQTLLEDAANFATATEHHLAFYTETILPECYQIASALNEQIFKAQGLEVKFVPEEMDIFQEDENDRATSLKALTDAGIPLILAMQMLGYDLPEGWTWEMLEEEEKRKQEQARAIADATAARQEQEVGANHDRAEEAQDEAEARNAQQKAEKELAAWRRYAAKHGAKKASDFNCDHIQPDLAAVVKARLEAAGTAEEVKAAFCGPFLVKAIPTEAALAKRLKDIYNEHWDDIAKAIGKGAMPDLVPLNSAIISALTTNLTEIVAGTMLQMMDDIGLWLDYGEVMTDAGAWARQYAYDLVNKAHGGLDATQRAKIQDVIGQLTDGKLTREDAIQLIKPLFGEVRAGMIVTTGVTRAHSAAAAMYKRELDKRGIETVERWLTAEDEKVCDICGPLDQTLKEVWGRQFPDGPPAHVNCRCRVNIEQAKKK